MLLVLPSLLHYCKKDDAFFSHRLTPCEKAWSAVKLEAFAVVTACDKLHHFLLGREFEVVFDQQGVKFPFQWKAKVCCQECQAC